MLVVCNFTGERIPFSQPLAFADSELLIANYPDVSGELRPYEAYIRYYEKSKE